MTLEQLRVFISVAERGHVTEGARALNLAQSAASHAIAALESRTTYGCSTGSAGALRLPKRA